MKNLHNLGIYSPKDITLDDKIKQKFFTYSYIDLYNRLFSIQPRKSFDNNERIFADYKYRNHKLREYIKPVIGTNEIMIYDSSQDKSIKVKVNLNKDIHGYEKFPLGCRHLYIEDKLYICGGVDPINLPINVALVYQPANNTITRITPEFYDTLNRVLGKSVTSKKLEQLKHRHREIINALKERQGAGRHNLSKLGSGLTTDQSGWREL